MQCSNLVSSKAWPSSNPCQIKAPQGFKLPRNLPLVKPIEGLIISNRFSRCNRMNNPRTPSSLKTIYRLPIWRLLKVRLCACTTQKRIQITIIIIMQTMSAMSLTSAQISNLSSRVRTRTPLRGMKSWWVCWHALTNRLLKSLVIKMRLSGRRGCKGFLRRTRSW